MGISSANNDLYREERLHRPSSYSNYCRRCSSSSRSFLVPSKLKSKMKSLKNIRKRIGFGSSSNHSLMCDLENLQPLRFHPIHGENISLNKDRTVARRRHSFCKGLTFSDRPIRVEERVYVKLAELADNWSGVIRFGYTTHNPVTLKGQLPKYACPELTSRKGFWGKAVNEREYAFHDNILFFYVSKSGNVYYGIEGKTRNLFFTGVDTTAPLWVMIDVYGNSTAVEFMNVQLNNTLTADQEAGFGLNNIRRSNCDSLETSLVSDMGRISLNGNAKEKLTPFQSSYIGPSVAFVGDAVGGLKNFKRSTESKKIPHNLILSPLPFHEKHGPHIRLSNDKCIATRTENEFTRGYVFSPRPIGANEFVVVQILNTERRYFGGLTFGMTSKNPAFIDPFNLPDDSDELLDDRDSFYVFKNVANSPNVGDILIFSLNEEGEMRMKKNSENQMTVFHVEKNLPYWWFFDLYGSTTRIRAHSGVAERPHYDTMLCNKGNHVSNVSAVPSAQRFSPSYPISAARLLYSPPAAAAAAAAANKDEQVSATVAVAAHQPAVFGNMPVLVLNCAIQGSRSSFEPIRIVIQNHTSVDSRTVNNQMVTTTPQYHSSQLFVPPDSCPISNINYVNVRKAQRETVDYALDNGTNQDYQLQEWVKTNVKNPMNSTGQNECIVCYEKPVDCVLYRCGHMCMCYDCARELWQGRGDGHCPYCRAFIRDVVRTFKS